MLARWGYASCMPAWWHFLAFFGKFTWWPSNRHLVKMWRSGDSWGDSLLLSHLVLTPFLPVYLQATSTLSHSLTNHENYGTRLLLRHLVVFTLYSAYLHATTTIAGARKLMYINKWEIQFGEIQNKTYIFVPLCSFYYLTIWLYKYAIWQLLMQSCFEAIKGLSRCCQRPSTWPENVDYFWQCRFF